MQILFWICIQRSFPLAPLSARYRPFPFWFYKQHFLSAAGRVRAWRRELGPSIGAEFSQGHLFSCANQALPLPTPHCWPSSSCSPNHKRPPAPSSSEMHSSSKDLDLVWRTGFLCCDHTHLLTFNLLLSAATLDGGDVKDCWSPLLKSLPLFSRMLILMPDLNHSLLYTLSWLGYLI